MTAQPLEEIVKDMIERFCFEFLETPFLCYTEHGIHALFYRELIDRIPDDRRTVEVNGKKIKIAQKEYCMRDSCHTDDNRVKTKRANWDIAVLSENQNGMPEGELRWYDCLKVNSAIEFGLNPNEVDHVEDDIERLSHPESGVEHGFVVHLYRLSENITRKDWGAKWSKRIWASKRLETFVSEVDMNKMIGKNRNKVIGYWALYDDIKEKKRGPFRLDGKSEPYLLPGGFP